MTALAKSLQTIKDTPSISGLLWKGKMWVTHPESPRACIIALSTFPSSLEKLSLFVAISLSVESLLVPFLAKGVLQHAGFCRQDSSHLKLTFNYISFESFSHLLNSCHQQGPCFNNLLLFTLQNKNGSSSMKLCPESYRLNLWHLSTPCRDLQQWNMSFQLITSDYNGQNISRFKFYKDFSRIFPFFFSVLLMHI